MEKKQRSGIIKTDTLKAVNLSPPSPIVGSPTLTLTVGEVANALSPIAPDVPGTMHKLRHWYREGVLQPAECEHEGPGKHRRYTGDAVYSAAFLHILTAAGLPVSHSRFLKDAMQQVNSKAAQWKAARDKGKELTLSPLVVGVTATGTSQVGERLKDARDVVLKIEIDLAKLFAQVDSPGPLKRE